MGRRSIATKAICGSVAVEQGMEVVAVGANKILSLSPSLPRVHTYARLIQEWGWGEGLPLTGPEP